MANPRELAEQAFALLQNALHESEARATDLDEQLKRKRAPKTRLEEQLDVLAHRLESVEAERQRWEQQAGQLEEIAEAERVKVAQLKKKLEIAESGPEKLTKKEVNFWRAKSETIDAQVKEYQERLTALRRDLNERDALIEQLKTTGANAEPAPLAQAEAVSDKELRRQLDQRDEWLAELRLELHELRAQPAPPLETQAEVETLRSQITGLERSLAESHNMRAAAQADLVRAEHEIAARERALREAIAATERAAREAAAAGERARTTLAEREHRIAELSAEAEHLRQELRQRDEVDRVDATRYEEQIAALNRDAEALRSRIEQDRHDTGSARAALEIALHEREHEVDRQRQLLASSEQELSRQRQLVASSEQELDKQRQLLAANERDFEELRRQLVERDQAAAETRRNLEEQRQELQERNRELADCQQQLSDLSHALRERDQRFNDSVGELEHVRATLTAQGREIESLRETLQSAQRELDEQRSEKQTLAAALQAADARVAAAAADMEAAREQLAGLEAELKEEREHAESLGELANERREHMTKLQEQVEEAEERYADANWRLGKSLYFERIVKRRKGLIKKLLDAIRAKMKANVALKAGIDGLRTFKQTAEVNQHKLLQRIDALKAELKEAEEIIKRHQGGTVAKEELTTALARATALEERLNTQAELIQQLEADLKTAKLSHKASTEQTGEFARLSKELESKNGIIEKLQADADEQQRKLSKLRGSESETQRLKALTEKDHAEIDALQREVAQLREALARQSEIAAASGNNADLEAKLKERENSVTRLMGTIKEHEATIKRLTESSESWKRKYQFLATDQPDAYKNDAEK